jgi:CHAD domain-containing protein
MSPRVYSIPADRVDEVLASLAGVFRTAEGRGVKRQEHFYDSFDDRLFRDGSFLALVDPGSRRPVLELSDLRHGLVRHTVRLNRALARQPLGFARDLPAGLLEGELAEVLGNRRLLPRIVLERTLRPLRLRLRGQRGILRVELGSAATAGAMATPLPFSLRFADEGPLAEALRAALAELGIAPQEEPPVVAAAAAAGRPFGAYDGKLHLDLQPAQSAAAAARAIHLALLATLELNEDGVRRDLDPEFLHDFRVALRRSRAALGQIRDVFPEPELSHFKRELSWLGEVTGPRRDLDVHMEVLPAYAAALAAGEEGQDATDRAAEDLRPLAELLAARQASAQAGLAAALDSPRYRRLLADWRRFLEERPIPETGPPPAAELPILHVAAARLRAIYKRIVRRGRKLGPQAPAEDLHQLRIDCKKLRYLLEFSRSLFPEQELDPTVKRLKGLQENLGELNDLEMQRAALKGFAADLGMPNGQAAGCRVETLLALGRLLQQAIDRQLVLREEFAELFEELATGDAKRFFRGLKQPAREAERVAAARAL